jgi:hypothetical protein
MDWVGLFNPYTADVLQHFAVPLEAFAIFIIFTDLSVHRKDREKSGGGGGIVAFGLGVGGKPPDRSGRILFGFSLALIAFAFECYQLATLHVAEPPVVSPFFAATSELPPL